MARLSEAQKGETSAVNGHLDAEAKAQSLSTSLSDIKKVEASSI